MIPEDPTYQWYASGHLPIGTKACLGRDGGCVCSGGRLMGTAMELDKRGGGWGGKAELWRSLLSLGLACIDYT